MSIGSQLGQQGGLLSSEQKSLSSTRTDERLTDPVVRSSPTAAAGGVLSLRDTNEVVWERFEGTGAPWALDLCSDMTSCVARLIETSPILLSHGHVFSIAVACWPEMKHVVRASPRQLIERQLAHLAHAFDVGVPPDAIIQYGVADAFLIRVTPTTGTEIKPVQYRLDTRQSVSASPDMIAERSTRDLTLTQDSAIPASMDAEQKKKDTSLLSEDPQSENSDAFMDTMRAYLFNRPRVAPDSLTPYIGEVIAWSPDGTHVIAHAKDHGTLYKLVVEAGENPSLCVFEGVSDDTEI